MLDQLFRRPRVRDRIRANLLGAWIEAYVAYLDATRPSPGHHPAVRPSRRALRRLARLRAHRPRGRDPGDDRFLPPRSSAPLSVPHSGPDLPVSGPSGPGPPAARPRRSSSQPPQPASPPTPVDVVLEHYGRYLRDTLRPGRVHLHLSGPLRPRIPPGQVRRRPREMGDDSAPRI